MVADFGVRTEIFKSVNYSLRGLRPGQIYRLLYILGPAELIGTGSFSEPTKPWPKRTELEKCSQKQFADWNFEALLLLFTIKDTMNCAEKTMKISHLNPNQSAPSIYIMIELCYFSLDQWEIRLRLLWGKSFNIPHSCDPHWNQTKFNDLLPLTIHGVLAKAMKDDWSVSNCTKIGAPPPLPPTFGTQKVNFRRHRLFKTKNRLLRQNFENLGLWHPTPYLGLCSTKKTVVWAATAISYPSIYLCLCERLIKKVPGITLRLKILASDFCKN